MELSLVQYHQTLCILEKISTKELFLIMMVYLGTISTQRIVALALEVGQLSLLHLQIFVCVLMKRWEVELVVSTAIVHLMGPIKVASV